MDTLLVADAEDSVIAIARTAAERAGLRLVSAENGIEALERYRAEGPRFVLVDRFLPLLDGLHVAGKIRDGPTGPITVIVLSGTLTAMVPDDTRTRLGLSGVLEKPFTSEDLFNAIVPFLASSDSSVNSAS